MISRANRLKRIAFAREHLNWTPTEWSKILWSDETKVNLFASDGRQYVRRMPNEEYAPRCLIPTVKGNGGSVMVWGCFLRAGVGPIARIEGTMDKYKYIDILNNTLFPYVRPRWPTGYTFQQDNDPKHTATYSKQWFIDNNIPVMAWPSQSPDLNPIEHLWSILKRDVRRARLSNLSQLYDVVVNSWKRISPIDCINLVDSMNNRCRQVIKNFGYPTRY